MKAIALDIETIGLDPWDNGVVWIISLYDGKKKTVIENCYGVNKSQVKELNEICADKSITKIIHNASFDCTYLEKVLGVKTVNIWDTMLSEQVLMGVRVERDAPDHIKDAYGSSLVHTMTRYGIKAHSKDVRNNFINRQFGFKFTKEEIDYAKADVACLFKIKANQEYLLTRDNLMEVALLENQAVEQTIRMRINGVNFDQDYWKKLARKNERLYKKLNDGLPQGINWRSHIQVKRFFESRYGVKFDSIKKLRESGERLNFPELDLYNQVKAIEKDVTTYGMNWFGGNIIKPDGKIHPDYFQMVDSGRYSCVNPNLQNQKSKSPHRGAFIPSPGNLLVRGDFTGQELAIMAAAAKEKIWIDALLRGDDLHTITAKALYGSEWDRHAKKSCAFPKKCSCPGHMLLRNNAKGLNFTLAYGGGHEKIGEKTGLSKFDASVLVARYKRVIPNITRWLEHNGKYARNHSASYSADKYQRYRRLRVYDNDPKNDWHVVNQGKNTPVQAAGANMLKLSLISIQSPYLALTVHDEIVLDVPKKEAKAVAKQLKIVMAKAADYITGIKGLVKVEPEITENLLKKG